jgi:hypothetical protein
MAMKKSNDMGKKGIPCLRIRQSRKVLDKLENKRIQGLYKNIIQIAEVTLCRRIFDDILCKEN